MNAPVWLGATTGQPGQAGQVNQFLAAHAVTYLYQGTQKSAQINASAGAPASNGLYLAQSFSTAGGQTVTGYVMVYAAVTGSPAPWVISLQSDNSSAPSGTVLSSAAVPKEFVTGIGGWVSVPLPATGLTASTRYWIVATAVGDSSDKYTWQKSNQVSGCSTSTNGTTWNAQAFGLMYQVYDQTLTLPLAGTWEDSGARWTWLSYTSGLVTGLQEYTAGQTANGYTAANRVLSYSSGILTGVA